ncbi:MAG: lysophospholipid acyltransferase family protein [Magnetococcales bacterium]|nr:lysophospholipid acyltransferase family protein [Magnetococcales bacterium]
MGKRIATFLMTRLVPWLIFGLLRMIRWTLHIERVGEPDPEGVDVPVIYAFWHGRMPLCAQHFPGRLHLGKQMHIIISDSRDGELVAKVTRLLGHEAVRGSSKRNGMRALFELTRIIKSGQDGGITPDGPKGPRYRLKEGAILLAKKSGAPIVPMTSSCTSYWEFGSWDRMRIAKPFSRGVTLFGRPIPVEPGIRGEALEAKRLEVEEAMNALSRYADHLCGHTDQEDPPRSAKDPQPGETPTDLINPVRPDFATDPMHIRFFGKRFITQKLKHKHKE